MPDATRLALVYPRRGLVFELLGAIWRVGKAFLVTAFFFFLIRDSGKEDVINQIILISKLPCLFKEYAL